MFASLRKNAYVCIMFETDGLKRGRFYHNKSRLRSLRQGSQVTQPS